MPRFGHVSTYAVVMLVNVAACACCAATSSKELPVATVQDSIAMVRIQLSAGADGSVGAFSPDGRKFATVMWRGDLARNTNVYSLLVFDFGDSSAGKAFAHEPRVLLTRDFPGDPHDHHGTPISTLTFLPDNRRLAFLGREGLAPAQVYVIDSDTRELHQLTKHPTAVRSFIVAADGTLRAFSAIADRDEDGGAERRARRAEDGVFLWDETLFPAARPFMKAAPLLGEAQRGATRQRRQYFLAGAPAPTLFFDSIQSRAPVAPNLNDLKVANGVTAGLDEEGAIRGWASLTPDPQGKRALLFPFGLTHHPMRPERYEFYARQTNEFVRRIAAPYGLVDLTSGRIERLLDAPHPQFNEHRIKGEALWMPDGRSIIVYTLLPLQSNDAGSDAAKEPPQWIEVELATRRYAPLPLPPGWDILRWDASGTDLVLKKGMSFALLPRRADGKWGALREVGSVSGLNRYWQVATNGRVVIGVKDTLLTPPELVAFDLRTGRTTPLTHLNPELHRRRYGSAEPFGWSHEYDSSASAFLIKPVDYRPGTRYPLVILLDDNLLNDVPETYLLDGFLQLSGHAIQMLAARGFAVLYTRGPKMPAGVWLSPQEGEYYRKHIEAAIAALDEAQLIDTRCVGISGWSRAGYQTDYLLIHSSHPFAAATQIDGGGFEYTDRFRPFSDDELKRIRAPLLFEPHGLATLTALASMSDRMEALGKATDILYFEAASHLTTRPQHRLRSLETHLDWWRFWLKGEEDDDPTKARQYLHWRDLRSKTSTACMPPMS